MKIAIDFNNTIAATDEALRHLIDTNYRDYQGLKYEELPHEIRRHLIDTITKHEDNYGLIEEPMDPDAAAIIHQLIKDGHEPYILTANPATVKPLIRKWLEKHGFPELTIKNVGPGKHHHKVHKNFDAIIDDRLEVLNPTLRKNVLRILYRNPHEDYPSHPHKEATNWQEVYDIINKQNA